jgi:hypothetical protein
MIRYALAWIPMVFLAIVNGVLREATYGKHLSELRSHQLSTLTGIVLMGGYIWLVTRRLGLESSTRAIRVGVLWLVLTVAFEFLFGHFVAGHSWGRLLHDYDLAAGRVWGFFLAFVAAAPWICYRLRR